MTGTAGGAGGPPERLLTLAYDGDDLIVPLANGEPVSVLDAIEAAAVAERFRGVRVHQRPVNRAAAAHEGAVWSCPRP